MATLYITEFKGLDKDSNGFVPQVMQVPPVAEQTVAVTGASVQSVALNPQTVMVRVVSDSLCCLAFGASPVAATTSMRMAADSAEYFRIVQGNKIAVIAGV